MTAADPLRTLRREVRDQLRVRIDARGLATSPPAERRVRVRARRSSSSGSAARCCRIASSRAS